MNADVLQEVLLYLTPLDYDAARLVCRFWRTTYDDRQLFFATAYVIQTIQAPEFWFLASQRPRVTSRPLPSFHLELKRLHDFISRCDSALCKEYFYSYWEICDKRAAVSRIGVRRM